MAKIKVRARTLDMLGRQQMASIPNALHELFKNAHDAYADKVEVDYYRDLKLLILWDDGVGMTKQDFEDRWLTLGTESKVRGEGIKPPYRDPNKPERPTLGEKGIGRLAIATVGPQVLILSRAQRETTRKKRVACFINWTFFEVPGLALDDIDIPVRRLEPEEAIDKELLLGFTRHTEELLEGLENFIPRSYGSRIKKDLASFKKISSSILDLAEELHVLNNRGTAFIIHPVDDVLEHDIDDEPDDLPSNLLKMLRGFSNTMMPTEAPPPLRASFRDHRLDGSVTNLIGQEGFFTPDEFLEADHHFEGHFDEYGQFTGAVQVYRETPTSYTVPWDGARGVPTKCGPFSVKIAYVLGIEKESLLPKEEHRRLCIKLNRFGGLYVYKDGIRILPYGNSDYDFLNIERRRTKAAKDWFFSYRRVFGAVELSNDQNGALVEKAGREGFRENTAYRQFRNILENFFKRLALDWFRETTAIHGDYHRLRDEQKRRALLLEKRELSIKAKKEKFSIALDVFFEEIEQKRPSIEAEEILNEIHVKIGFVKSLNADDAAKELIRLETETRRRIDELRDKYRVTRPRNIGLNKALLKNWERAIEISMRLEEDFFTPLDEKLETAITDAIEETRALVNRRRRIEERIRDREQRDLRRAKSISKEVRAETDSLEQEVVSLAKKSISTLDGVFKSAISNLERKDLSILGEHEVQAFQQSLESQLEGAVGKQIDELEGLRDQIQAVLESIREGTPLGETTAALEEQTKLLEERVEHYGELAQIGAALGIVQHEFASTVRGLRSSIQMLRPWADKHPDLQSTYRTIRNTFEHLDTYLTMFTDMDRRLYRKAISINGQAIHSYIMQFFEERFQRHGITVTTTERFNAHKVTSFPSTIMPPFINILDNALYWLTKDSSGKALPSENEKRIRLDADSQGFLISNNGPGIDQRDVNQIFDFAFTRKLRGRGMGLAISKKALRDAGLDLTLETVGRGTSPVFRIWTAPQKTTNE